MTYSHQAVCRFVVASWTESAIIDIDGEGATFGESYYPTRGFSRAEVTYRYSGDIEGTGALTYLIAYRTGEAPTLGFERFEGSIGGHDGTCVLRHIGSHDGASVGGQVEVLAGMGTGGLSGLRGEAELKIAGHSDDGYELVLDYDID